MVRAFVFVAVAAACVMLQAQAGPQTPPVFHAGVHLVTVDVSVLDNDYRVVHGLSAGDFKIFENGVPQKVAAFSEVNIPDAEGVPGSWNREVAPDVRTNGADDGRLVILLLDDAMARADEGGMPAATGLSKEQRAALPPEAMKESAVSIATKAIARAVVDRLGPADRAAVIFTFEKQGTQDFTTDRARLRASIDRFVPKQFAAGGGAPYDWRRVSLDASASVARYPRLDSQSPEISDLHQRRHSGEIRRQAVHESPAGRRFGHDARDDDHGAGAALQRQRVRVQSRRVQGCRRNAAPRKGGHN